MGRWSYIIMGWRLAAAAMVDGEIVGFCGGRRAAWVRHLWRHIWQNLPAKSSPLSLLFVSAGCGMGGAGLVFNSAILVPYHGREEDKAASTSWWP